MSSISKNALLVALQISTWSARRYDDRASVAVHDKFGSDKDTGRYNKCLIDVKHPSFRSLNQLATSIREWHYTHTLAWAQNGVQLLPAAEYFEYANEMRQFQERFEDAVEAFLADYPHLKAQARKALNGLYEESDYPSATAIGEKYNFNVVYLPVPDSKDFRVDIGQRDAQQIAEQIEEHTQEAVATAMRELWERLYEPVSHMAEMLPREYRDSKNQVISPRWADSLVSNVQEIVDLLPRLNVTGDQHLAKLGEEVKAKLTLHSPDALRANPDMRNAAAKQAAEIAARIKSLGFA